MISNQLYVINNKIYQATTKRNVRRYPKAVKRNVRRYQKTVKRLSYPSKELTGHPTGHQKAPPKNLKAFHASHLRDMQAVWNTIHKYLILFMNMQAF
jgi:hypothetical protein